jgi:hypothetical protein
MYLPRVSLCISVRGLIKLNLSFPPSFLDTYSNSLLNKHGLIINTVYHTLICVECGCTIDHQKIRAHFVSDHKGIKLPRDIDNTFAAMFSEQYPHLVYPPSPPCDPVPAIYGLREPLQCYRICTSCRRGFKGRDPSDRSAPISKAFDKHICHSGQPNPSHRIYFESHVQSFERHLRSPFFPVLPPTPTPQPPNPWTKYLSHMNSRSKPAHTMSIPDNYRVVDQFLRKEGWLAHVEGLDPAKIQHLITLSRDDPLVPHLAKHCQSYLQHHQESLTSYYARRLISTRPRSVYYRSEA